MTVSLQWTSREARAGILPGDMLRSDIDPPTPLVSMPDPLKAQKTFQLTSTKQGLQLHCVFSPNPCGVDNGPVNKALVFDSRWKRSHAFPNRWHLPIPM